jgi:hypothetical protein
VHANPFSRGERPHPSCRTCGSTVCHFAGTLGPAPTEWADSGMGRRQGIALPKAADACSFARRDSGGYWPPALALAARREGACKTPRHRSSEPLQRSIVAVNPVGPGEREAITGDLVRSTARPCSASRRRAAHREVCLTATRRRDLASAGGGGYGSPGTVYTNFVPGNTHSACGALCT